MTLLAHLDPDMRRQLARLARLQDRSTSAVELAAMATEILAEALRERTPRAERIAAARRAHERHHLTREQRP